MGKEIMFGDTEVEKDKFHQHKSPISIYDVNVDIIIVSNRVPIEKVLNILLGTKLVKK